MELKFKKIFEGLNYQFVPEDEILKRIENFKKIVDEKELDVVVVTSKVNNFYFTGTNQEQVLIIFNDKLPVLFVRRDIYRAKLESPLEVEKLNGLKQIKELLEGKKVGLEFNYLTVKEFLKYKNIINGEIFDISDEISKLRQVKSPWEINCMKKAGDIAGKVYMEGLNYLKEGITEIEFGSILFSIAQKTGHEGILRTGSNHFEPVSWHVLSGISGCLHGQYDAPASGIGLSPAFPNSAGFKKIKKHEPIMVDFGITYFGYQVDSTRMFSIGEPEERFSFYYEKSKLIEKEISNELFVGNNCSKVYDKGILKAKELNVYNEFLGVGENKKKFVGHGVGLETSEMPLIAENVNVKIENFSTIAIEPKMVVENLGIIGIENSYVVTSVGLTNLTDFHDDILKC